MAAILQGPLRRFQIDLRVGHRFPKRVVALSDCLITLKADYLFSKGKKRVVFFFFFKCLVLFFSFSFHSAK